MITPTLLLAAALAYPMCDVAYPPGTRRKGVAHCLQDADSGHEHGRQWRLKGVDAPETTRYNADCAAEVPIGKAVTAWAHDLLSGGYTINWLDELGGLGRDLVTITLPDGRDYGSVMIELGYAVPWPHPKGIWCR